MIILFLINYLLTPVSPGSILKFYNLQFQMIIPGSWIFAGIVNIPLFLAKNTKVKNGRVLCVPTWPEIWMEAFIMILSVVVGVSLIMMIALNSRVVYTLWFQRKDEHQLNIQQKVQIVLCNTTPRRK